MKSRLLIYGATGHTGRLIAAEAAECFKEEPGQIKRSPQPVAPVWRRAPILAGRDADALQELGDELGLPTMAVRLDDARALDRALRDVAVIINAAGPFNATAEPLVKACLRTGTHYLDVSGELDVFRAIDNYHVDAVDLGVMLMPGVGFVVLASDYLTRRMQLWFKAKGLELDAVRVALSRVDFLSRGTIRSMLDGAREGVLTRRHGKLVSHPAGRLERLFRFRGNRRARPINCTAIQLPDLVTAPWTTGEGDPDKGVRHVETYGEANFFHRLQYTVSGVLALAFQTWPLGDQLRRQAAWLPADPSPDDGDDHEQCILVEGEDRYGAITHTMRFRVPDSYRFSAWSSVRIAEEVLRAKAKADRQAKLQANGSANTNGLVNSAGKPIAGFATPAGVFFKALHAEFNDQDGGDDIDWVDGSVGVTA